MLAGTQSAPASAIVLKDGRRLEGNIAQITGMADNPQGPKNDAALITLVDDNLRRIFIPTYRVLRIDEADSGEVKEKINISQPKVRRESGSRVSHVGQLVNVTPFDKFGRRTVRMITDKGPFDVVQGITVLTPLWTKVEAMASDGRPSVVWEMRIATSSIPRETLHDILASYIDHKKLEQRLRIPRLLLQAERYQDAQKELEAILVDFPQAKELAAMVQALRQLYARSIVKEIEVRRKAGQHVLAYNMLQSFPAEGVAGEILQQVRDMLDEYAEMQKKVKQLHSELTEHIGAIKDTETRRQCEAVFKEMNEELNINTFDRMAAYMQLQGTGFSPEQNVALAISGWLLGSDHSDPNLQVALSLVKIRDLVSEYLNQPVKLERNQMFDRIRSQEGASVAQVAQLIAHMKPPIDTPPPSPSEPGFYNLRIPVGIDNEPDVTYYVQLPPEYDPHRALSDDRDAQRANRARRSDRSTGGPAPWTNKRHRLGQATRLGYIVIAVDWMKDGQSEYEYSAREHAAVLGSLRDACRRFSIDTDRVFLTGHSIGGDAAWDIGLAHPDLWAGVIPIVAESRKILPAVLGKRPPRAVLRAGRRARRRQDRQERPRLGPLPDAQVRRHGGRVSGAGARGFLRGHSQPVRLDGTAREPQLLSQGIHRFDDAHLGQFLLVVRGGETAVAQRSSSRATGRRAAARTTAKIAAHVLTGTNGVSVSTGASEVTVWLSPEVVDFSREMKVVVNGKTITKRGLRAAGLEACCWKTCAPAPTGCTRSGRRSSSRNDWQQGPNCSRRRALIDLLVEHESGQQPAVTLGGGGHAGGAQVAADHVELGQLAAVDALGADHPFLAFAQQVVEQPAHHRFGLGHLAGLAAIRRCRDRRRRCG